LKLHLQVDSDTLSQCATNLITANYTVTYLFIVIGNMSSLRVVECPQFRTLIKGLAPHASVMSRKNFVKTHCWQARKHDCGGNRNTSSSSLHMTIRT